MSGSIVWRLIVKDLFFLRWFVVGSIVAGAASVAVMPLGRVPSYVGGVTLICTLIVLNIFLVMNGVVQERKDKVMQFILSLPVSTTEYVMAKVSANAIAFGVSWLTLTIATMVVVDRSSVANGVLPFWVAILGYLLCYHWALLAVGLLADSSGSHATAITIGNVSVNFLIPFLLSRPSIRQHADGAAAVWTSDIVAIIAIELVAGIVILATAVYARTRRPDFV